MITALALALSLLGAGAQVPPGATEAALHVIPQDAGSGFRTLRAADVTVHHAPADSARAARLLANLRRQGPLPALPDALPRDVQVYLAPDRAAFDSLAGGRIPEWGAGVAVPALGRIVLPGFAGRNTGGREELRVLRHEWAHVGLHQFLEGVRIPRWFDEGYAEWASGGWNAREGWRLRIALAGRGTPPMDSLTLSWPRERRSAELAYMLSGTAVEYLVRRSGPEALAFFLRRWRDIGDFETALRSVYGVTGAQLEEDWREYVKDRYGWLFVLSHSVVFWLFLSLVLLVMVWIRRRRNREAMARLRATDPAEEPAWWTWPPGGSPPRASPESEASGRPDPDRSPERGTVDPHPRGE